MDTIRKAAGLLAILAAGAFAQGTSNENQVRDRGQTRTADETQTLARGRIGTQDAVPNQPLTLHGLLVEADCRDRSTRNLRQPPQNPEIAGAPESAAAGAAQSANGRSSHGVSVDSSTLDAERSDAMQHQVPDLRARQRDTTCAITGTTRLFALLMDNGRLLNLDEGGNTKAIQAVQANPAGRKMLNGMGPAIKPKVTITGRIHGDRAVVDRLKIE
jgi:hypothetical protein